MDKLKIRAYSIRFGDAFLISVPDRGPGGVVETRHILVDVGNVLNKEGGRDDVFQPVVKNILEVLNGKALDLYIMTHEHMDHTQGLHYADVHYYPNEDLIKKLKVRYAWLTASSAEDYYDYHPDAKKKKLEMEEMYMAIQSYLSFLKASGEELPGPMVALMLNNNPRSTKENVKYLRKLTDNTCYVYRGFNPSGNHPFHEAQFEIWAPEEDTSTYYTRLRSMALGIKKASKGKGESILAEMTPPSGVDAGAFYNLTQHRRGYIENLLAIDKAANNSSIVFCLKWRGWKLLFTGDAEVRSWKKMNEKGVLKPVHFLKISHHGSHNGTPEPSLLNQVLPPGQQNGRRVALVTTWRGTYNNVPDTDTLELYDPAVPVGQRRCDELHILDETMQAGTFKDIEFEDLS